MMDFKCIKFFIIAALCIFINTPAFANNTVLVKSLSNFSSMHPRYYISVIVVEEHKFKSGFVLEKNTVLNLKVEKITEPKRGKRNVYIVVHPTTFNVPSKSQKRKFQNRHLMAKVTPYKKLNKTQAAEKGAVSATGIIIPGFSQAFYFCKGFINPEENKTRLASGGISTYENSPLSYIEKGSELKINRGDYLKLKFYDETTPKWKIFKGL